MKKSLTSYLLLTLILVIGASLRLWDVNWDQNHHLHPDERFLTMVANDSHVPASVLDYLNPKVSTLVPYNIGKDYFTYGAFPVALTKVVAVLIHLDNYDDLALVGRVLAAIFDTLTILFVFLLAKQFFTRQAALAAALVYALSVLPIQHAHFFVVDAFGNSFFTAALVLCAGFPLGAGLLFGAALSCKISFILQAPVILILLLRRALRSARWLPNILISILLVGIGSYLALRICDPKFFASAAWWNPTINKQFIANLLELKRLSDYSEHPWPPGVQWLSKTPYLFTIQNFVLYGFGLVATWFALVGAWTHRHLRSVQLMALWIVLFMLYAGGQFLQTMRYLYPIYPLAAVLAGLGISTRLERCSKWQASVATLIVLALAFWPAAFLHIYRGEHTRIEASRWINKHLKYDAKICAEHWDDTLPLRLPGYDFAFQFIELPVFEQDSPQKIELLRSRMSQCDAIVFSSNRGWGSLMPLEKRFFLTAAWYRELFDGTGDFAEVYRLAKRPELFGFQISEAFADEAFSVYDHPEVHIFMRRKLPES